MRSPKKPQISRHAISKLKKGNVVDNRTVHFPNILVVSTVCNGSIYEYYLTFPDSRVAILSRQLTFSHAESHLERLFEPTGMCKSQAFERLGASETVT